ncbi:predicted protein [Nematostella vectensis]|uniref:Uncharacterized protein n=1 Tax=Nematostella vectensis TaxID=45351 RepID=A7SSV7_NEMVE|nr:predicted protein [Nematostella vectensis]|eukprot:XP_001625305.1 predicted protein [Nematostella vectensis]
MTTAISEMYEPIIGQTFNHIKARMVELQKAIREEDEKTKELKMAVKEERHRERAAVDKQRCIGDRMQEIDTMIEKIHAKIQYTKEREFVATRRYEENMKLCETLKKNKIDVPGYEEKTADKLSEAKNIVKDIAEVNKKIEEKKAKLYDLERRHLRAMNKIDHYEETLRASEQIGKRVVTNYTPKSDQEYQEIISDLRDGIKHAADRLRNAESKTRDLEKLEEEAQARIDHFKNKSLLIQQTKHEMEGSRL